MRKTTAAQAFAAILFALAAPSRASDLIYIQIAPPALYDIDTSTGISALRTLVSGSVVFMSMDRHPFTGEVYGLQSTVIDALSIVDVDTGVVTPVARTYPVVFDSMAFDPTTGVLYALGFNNDELYTIDLTDGAATRIGWPVGVHAGLCFDPDGQLHGFNAVGGLYTIDKTTAHATYVGSSGPALNDTNDATYTLPGEILITGNGGDILSCDPSTGARTFIANTSPTGSLHGVIEDRAWPTPPLVYCTAKVNSQGCTPTIGTQGAAVQPTSGADDYDVVVDLVLNGKYGIIFLGHGPLSTPFLGGYLCVNPPLERSPVMSTGGNPPPADCSGRLILRVNDPAGVNFGQGSSVYFQGWSRDPSDPAGYTTNLSDAVRLTYL